MTRSFFKLSTLSLLSTLGFMSFAMAEDMAEVHIHNLDIDQQDAYPYLFVSRKGLMQKVKIPPKGESSFEKIPTGEYTTIMLMANPNSGDKCLDAKVRGDKPIHLTKDDTGDKALGISVAYNKERHNSTCHITTSP